MFKIGMGECHAPLPFKADGGGHGIPHGKYYCEGNGYAYSVQVVELTDECIERIAESVVRKMNEPKEERTCGNCKHSIGKHSPFTYVVCNKEGAELDGKYLDKHLMACERWEKE